MTEHKRFCRRSRMWLDHQVPGVADVAPRTDELVAGLDKIDWTLVLRSPSLFQDLCFPHIDLEKRPWTQQRIHGEIFRSQKSIAVRSSPKSFNELQRNHAPALNHAR